LGDEILLDDDLGSSAKKFDFGWRDRGGFVDPGPLPDPERRRGGGATLTTQERDWLYFWARKKRLWVESHMVCSCWDPCPRCKLCRNCVCRSLRHRHEAEWQCLCRTGHKMFSPQVVRPL
jgi:hypothetical protein